MKFYISLLFSFVILISVNRSAFGVMANPRPVQIIQPDGTKITIILKGDEHVKWAQTLDGYSILRNNKGVFEYATLNLNEDLVPSGIHVKNPIERSSLDIEFLGKTKKGLIYSKSQIGLMRSISKMYQSSVQKAFQTTGNKNLICVLIGFTDKAFTKTQADFNNLYNQLGYTENGATGSVKDFYLENSYNQLNLSVTVAGPYTASHNMGYYGGNDSNGEDLRPRELIAEAVNLANPDVDYSNFDNDHNGSVDGVYVIFAGYDESGGAPANAIWAHAWNLATTLILDGKAISDYSCSSELNGNSGTDITGIGGICHEFGHILGSPDFYDTNYGTNGSYIGTGDWDIMASGSWNNDSKTPAHHNAYTKTMVYNWASATILSSGSQITLTNAVENPNSFYRYNTATTDEYFLIENRQKLNFDTYIPGHGMIIYHVDGNYISTADNSINAGSHQGMYPVCASATGNPTATYGIIDGGGCPFPGTAGKTSFTDVTIPNSLSWADENTAKPIQNIIENNTYKTVSFAFMGGVTCTTPESQASDFTSSALADNSMTLEWIRGSGSSILVIARQENAVNEIPVNGTHYTANASFASGTEIGTGNYVVYNGTGTSVNISSLTSGTSYYYSIYEYNTTTDCYLTPALTGKATTTGISPKLYCAAGSTATTYEYISNLKFGTINQKSLRGTSGYQDYTSQITNMQIGSIDSAVISVSNFYKTDQILIWIDWNQDKDFEDEDEMVYISKGSGFLSPLMTTSFEPPANATLGKTRMRIRLHDATNGSNTTSCGDADWGEVEDYSINVIPMPCLPPSVGTITQPTCTLATGSVVLNDLPSKGTWTLSRFPGGTTITGTGKSTTISRLASGTYIYTVTNSSGCISEASENVVINEQPVTPSIPEIVSISQPFCDITTGSVELSGLPESGIWTLTRTPDGVTVTGTTESTTITDLPTGTYTYAVSNVSGCISESSANVVIDIQPSIPAAPSIGIITQPTCSVATGSVVLSGLPSGGTWTLTSSPDGKTFTGTGTSLKISGLLPGIYFYTVTNSECTSPQSGNVIIKFMPEAPVVGKITQPTCTLSTGSVVFSGLPSTGTWTLTRTPNGITTRGTGTSKTISGLPSGTYTYTVKNALGCISATSDNVVIDAQPVTPSVPIVGVITQPTCPSPTGSVVLNGLPATGTWTLTRTPGAITTTGTGVSSLITGLAAGTYTYKVVNESSICISAASASIAIKTPSTIQTPPKVGTITQPTCTVATGSVVLSSLPKTGGWKLTRTPGGTITTGTGASVTISGLLAGTYTYVVTNASECTSVSSANVIIKTQPVSPDAPSIGTITQPTCSLATGSVVINGLPPTGTWTLTRAPGATVTTGTGISKTISGLSAGTYTYKVKNSVGCTSGASDNVVINTQPATPTAPKVGTITQPTCTSATGSVIMSNLPSSGTWTLTKTPGGTITTGAGTSTTISDLLAGSYTYKTTNQIGCTSVSSGSVVIKTQPATPAAPIVGTITQPTTSLATGSVVLSGLPSGKWLLTRSPGAVTTSGTGSSKTISGLVSGTYTFTVKNTLGCTSLESNIVVINTQPSGTLKAAAVSENPTIEASDKNEYIKALNVNPNTDSKSVLVYPNPASESFAIRFNYPVEGRVNVSLINSAGKIMMEFQAENIDDERLKSIPVNNLVSGIYVVKVFLNPKELYYAKIIVVK